MITLYHGSNVEVVTPLVGVGRVNLDFGRGFYLTSIRKQAVDWAITIASRRGRYQKGVISEYRFDKETVKKILGEFASVYDCADDNSAWFEKVKSVANANGFATDMKAFKADPSAFPGSVSDVAEMLRVATTGLTNTPDLCTIMQILGKEATLSRLENAVKAL